MVCKSVVIVLPKLSSYLYKDVNLKERFEKVLDNWINKYNKAGFSIYAFREDILAMTLLGKRDDITWIKTLSTADTHFVKTRVADVPEEYSPVRKCEECANIIQKAKTKFPIKSSKLGLKDSDEELELRLKSIEARIRFVANAILADRIYAPNILFFDANNNFCNKPAVEEGNGVTIATVYVPTFRTEISMGGVGIEEEMYTEILRRY